MTTKKKYYGSQDLEKRLGPITLGSFLRSWRLSEDMSQQEFADLIEMSSANLCDIEKGRKGISPKKAAEIAKKIGYSTTVLVEFALNDLLMDAGLKFEVSVKNKLKKKKTKSSQTFKSQSA